MSNIYTDTEQIKATVKTDWSHKNCKFQPGDRVEVSAQVLPRDWVGTDGTIKAGRSYVSRRKQRRVGRVGEVVAVSCLPNGRIRGDGYPGTSRMYTKYYIQFGDGVIMGYDSHHLNRAFGWQTHAQKQKGL